MKRIELFTILGFRVSLDLTWIILAVLVTWSLATGYFPGIIDGLDQTTAWWLGAAGALGLFVSIILHEFAHSWIARQFDLPIRGITLFIFGGVAEMEEEPSNARAEFYMAIAGPIMSYMLAALFFGLRAASHGAISQALFGYLAFINVLLATFNLIPAFPLDGGRIFRAAFWWWTKDYARATRVSATMGRVFGSFLILIGIVGLISGSPIAGIWQALIGYFIISAASSSELQMNLKTGLEGRTVAQVMTRNPVSIPASTPMDEVIENYFFRYHHRAFPVVRDGVLLGCIRIEDVGKVPREVRGGKKVGDLLTPDIRIATVTPDMAAIDALKVMQHNKSSRLVVSENGVLKGMLTMRDILNDLAIRQELDARQREN